MENLSTIINKQDIPESLPSPVKKWIYQSGVVGQEVVQTAALQQTFKLKLNQNDKNWSIGKAEQVFNISEPAFDWRIGLRIKKIIPISGRDIFQDGKGSMKIKLLSIFPIVSASQNTKIDESTLLRFLAEMMWFPSAALRPWMKWEAINNDCARAIINWKGLTGSGTFHFSENGDVQRFETKRFMSEKDDFRVGWRADVDEIQEFDDIRIPKRVSVTWELQEGDWTWAEIELSKIAFNFTR